MATNPHQHSGSSHDGQARGRGARWLVAGLGFIWLIRSAVRGKRHQAPYAAAAEISEQESPHNKPLSGHEQRDANVPWIFGIVAFLLVSGLCIHFILAGLLALMKRSPPPTDRWQPAPQTKQAVPPAGSFPILQVSPPADLQAFRSREEAELHTYGWVNQTAGIVRVPIERAIGLLLQHGLPVRTETNQHQLGPSPVQLIQQRLEHRAPEIYDEK